MRAILLAVLTLAAAATAGAAAAQSGGQTDGNGGGQPRVGGVETGPTRLSTPTPPLPVFAVIGHHLVSGELKPSAPLMALVDARQPTFSCAPSERGWEITLSCSDGSNAQLLLNGSGCGRSVGGEPASMCVGVAAKDAMPRLSAPAGKTLRLDGERLVLDPVAG